ncbi:hypothetical protein ACFFF5_21140 [Lederbergia wuyishanensis]|uniref:Rubrerythrin n=1 Tax=Lederbergia wuyishanensis TaxID=1347903 RepID=A0ABU0D7A9_9BACI|nr:hypothetical protein [Lederbergia wuyishanensis]MCJ8008922.1 hypothetical protein [Lederbergia wuyishanensis]MDQ0344248.1 rubrerythrin [Lederbergia wuyishanensis]
MSVNKEKYRCDSCGEFIYDDEGITAVYGDWVCDKDDCRILTDDNLAIVKNRRKNDKEQLEEVMRREYKEYDVRGRFLVIPKGDYKRLISTVEEQAERLENLEKITCCICNNSWRTRQKHCPQCEGKGYVYIDMEESK